MGVTKREDGMSDVAIERMAAALADRVQDIINNHMREDIEKFCVEYIKASIADLMKREMDKN
jgi:hypothetical protein